jgi:hypothetical protein
VIEAFIAPANAIIVIRRLIRIAQEGDGAAHLGHRASMKGCSRRSSDRRLLTGLADDDHTQP